MNELKEFEMAEAKFKRAKNIHRMSRFVGEAVKAVQEMI